MILGLARIPQPDHAADALAVAISHTHHNSDGMRAARGPARGGAAVIASRPRQAAAWSTASAPSSRWAASASRCWPRGARSAARGQLGEDVSLHTYLHVREDALQLFGFRERRRARVLPVAHRPSAALGPRWRSPCSRAIRWTSSSWPWPATTSRSSRASPASARSSRSAWWWSSRTRSASCRRSSAGEAGAPAARRRPTRFLGRTLRAAEPRPHAARGRGGAARRARGRAARGAGQVRPHAQGRRRRDRAPIDRIGDPKERADDRDLELGLRPRRFADFVGQRVAKEQLEIFVAGRQAARRHARPRAARRPARPGQDHAGRHHRHRSWAWACTPPPGRRSSARATSPACSPTCRRATSSSSTRSTASTPPSRRSSTRRWRTTRSTS